jgi:hypothetical protein
MSWSWIYRIISFGLVVFDELSAGASAAVDEMAAS